MPVMDAVMKPFKAVVSAVIGVIMMFVGLVIWSLQLLLEIPLGILRWLQVHFPSPNNIWNYYCHSDVQDVEQGVPTTDATATTSRADVPVAGPSGTYQQTADRDVNVPAESTTQKMVPVGGERAVYQHHIPPTSSVPPHATGPATNTIPTFATVQFQSDEQAMTDTFGAAPARTTTRGSYAAAVARTPTTVDHTHDTADRQKFTDRNAHPESMLPPPVKSVPTQDQDDHVINVDMPV